MILGFTTLYRFDIIGWSWGRMLTVCLFPRHCGQAAGRAEHLLVVEIWVRSRSTANLTVQHTQQYSGHDSQARLVALRTDSMRGGAGEKERGTHGGSRGEGVDEAETNGLLFVGT
ncbi:uncharacterized protein VTP21DRAFT_11287 [Calcarisporiella thermophila]|uniref:uncharacterized protein n=1 Tax=Calcarisporiella thermophila TaxID=911321 RepID=UPI003742ED58